MVGVGERGGVGWSRLVEGARKIRIDNYVAVSDQLCRYSCSIIVYYINAEVGETYYVGRPANLCFPYKL